MAPTNRTENKVKKSVSLLARHTLCCLFALLFAGRHTMAQETRVTARLDATSITVGDQARLFLDVQHDPATGVVQWAPISDTFNHLEVVERGKIDTLKQGNQITYRQRLLITGFDSGVFKIPTFTFAVVPNGGNPYAVQSDSLLLIVSTVAVDTTKDFKPIKGIITVETSWWEEHMWLIIGIVIAALAGGGLVWYLKSRRKEAPAPELPKESLHDRTMRQLQELEDKKLWQNRQVKEYYVQLTDIVRNYIEERFNTAAMELTTDELLHKAQHQRELMPYVSQLSFILSTADLAKFAKAEPLPQEHIDSIDKARQLVTMSKPVEVIPQPNQPGPSTGKKI